MTEISVDIQAAPIHRGTCTRVELNKRESSRFGQPFNGKYKESRTHERNWRILILLRRPVPSFLLGAVDTDPLT